MTDQEQIRARRELEDFNAEICPIVYKSASHYLILIEKLDGQESMGGEEFRFFIDDMRDIQKILIDIQRKIDLVEDIYDGKGLPIQDDPRPARGLLHQMISNYRTLSNAHNFDHLKRLVDHLKKTRAHFKDQFEDKNFSPWFKAYVRELEK